MSVRKRFLIFLAMVLCSLAPAWPCSYDPAYSYFGDFGQKDLFYIPETHFDSEYIRITGMLPDLDAENKRYPEEWSFDDGQTIFVENYSVALALTEGAERAVLNEVLSGNTDRDRIMADFGRLRAALGEYTKGLRRNAFQGIYRFYYSKGNDADPPPFDLEPYRTVLTEIPEEFSLYILGATEYHNKNYGAAKTHFQAVMALEPDKRKFKTVWAAYMLGRTCLALNEPGEARGYFEQVRALAAEGFPDPLGLVQESWGWQGRAHLLSGEYPEAIRAYVEFRKLPGKWFMARRSFYTVFAAAFKDGDKCAMLARDPLARQLATAWLTGISYFDDDKVRRWLEANATLPVEENIEGADGLAWLAYKNGEMDTANRWLGQSDPASAKALFVQSKMLLREGKIEEGTALLGKIADTAGEERSLFYEGGYPYTAERTVRSAYAGSLLKNGQYAEALKELILTSPEDAEIVATRVLTIPELAAAVEGFKKDEKYNDSNEGRREDFFKKVWYHPIFKQTVTRMENLLAQRLARQGDWERAALHYDTEKKYHYFDTSGQRQPTPYLLADEAIAVGKHLKAAKDVSLSQREQAEHLFEAATIIWDKGDLLLGGWCLRAGLGIPGQPEPGETLMTDDARRRMAENSALCGLQFYYRFMAADLMKQCAALLPNNDVLAAKALYLGGTFLKARYPQEADYFYKALVQRNPNLLIARQADELRWFPKEFTDVVLYTPLPKSFLRKRTLAFLLMILLPLIATGAWVALKKKAGKPVESVEFTKEKL